MSNEETTPENEATSGEVNVPSEIIEEEQETTALEVSPQQGELTQKEQKEQATTAIVQSATGGLAETFDLMGMLRWAKVLAASGMFSDVRQPAQALVKIMAGRELGLGPMASLSAFYFFSGKPVLSANAMSAIIRNSNRYDFKVEELTNEKCVLRFYRVFGFIPGTMEIAKEDLGVSSFSMEDATRAGLVGRGPNWKAYPRNMLYARAMSNGAKWFCADLFTGGAYVQGEIAGDGSTIDAEAIITE